MTLTAGREEGVYLGGQPVDGTVELTSGSSVDLPEGRVGSVSGADGTYGLAVWDPSAPTLTGLRTIATYPFDPAWIVDARYRPAPAGRITEVERLTNPRGTDTLPAPADLIFELGGERRTLMVVESLGELLVIFTDSTSGRDTPEIGRWLLLSRPAGDTIRIDFNRAVLPLHAFSAVFPCPLPPAGNHLPPRVEAGERTPVFAEH